LDNPLVELGLYAGAQTVHRLDRTLGDLPERKEGRMYLPCFCPRETRSSRVLDEGRSFPIGRYLKLVDRDNELRIGRLR
jgi:hypothetical protein